MSNLIADLAQARIMECYESVLHRIMLARHALTANKLDSWVIVSQQGKFPSALCLQ